MQPPKFPFLMPVWSNRVGILRPDQSEGKLAPWIVSGVRLRKHYDQSSEVPSYGGYEYLIGTADGSDDDYGWVPEVELVKAEYPALADDTVPLEEHPDLDDVRNMSATSVGRHPLTPETSWPRN